MDIEAKVGRSRGTSEKFPFSEETELIPVRCGTRLGHLSRSRFVCPGIDQPCVMLDGGVQWVTPKELVVLGGKTSQKDWKASIKVIEEGGRSKSLGVWMRSHGKQLDFFRHDVICGRKCESRNFVGRQKKHDAEPKEGVQKVRRGRPSMALAPRLLDPADVVFATPSVSSPPLPSPSMSPWETNIIGPGTPFSFCSFRSEEEDPVIDVVGGIDEKLKVGGAEKPLDLSIQKPIDHFLLQTLAPFIKNPLMHHLLPQLLNFNQPTPAPEPPLAPNSGTELEEQVLQMLEAIGQDPIWNANQQ